MILNDNNLQYYSYYLISKTYVWRGMLRENTLEKAIEQHVLMTSPIEQNGTLPSWHSQFQCFHSNKISRVLQGSGDKVQKDPRGCDGVISWKFLIKYHKYSFDFLIIIMNQLQLMHLLRIHFVPYRTQTYGNLLSS